MTHITRLVTLVLAAALFVISTALPASAHVELADATPGDGATVTGPVSSIVLTFSAEADPAGEGFVVLDAAGAAVSATPSVGDDGLTWTLALAEPVDVGPLGVRWTMKAGDAHPRQGTVRFVVVSASGIAGPEGGASLSGQESADALEAALQLHDPTAGARRIGALGRAISFTGVVLGVGALAFAVFVLRGRQSDVVLASYWIRRFAVAALMGASFEFVAQVVIDADGTLVAPLLPGPLIATVASWTGCAIGLRIVGGAVLARAVGLGTVVADDRLEPVERLHAALPIAAGPATATLVRARSVARLHRFDLQSSPTATWGASTMVVSFALDGHTVSEGSRLVMTLASMAHVTAAAVWAGGVVMLGIVIRSWRRLDRRKSALLLAARFSVLAAASLVMAGVAGILLALGVMESPATLVSTAWGWSLVAKLALVAVAAGLGHHNHSRIIPALTSGDDMALARFRRVLAAEAAVFVLIIVVTAILVGSSAVSA